MRKYLQQINSKKESGFTLIEALVSAAIFATAMVVVTGAFIYVSQLNRRTNAIRVANDNARYITEFFSKEIRNGRVNFGFATAIGPCSTTITAGASQSLFITNVNGDLECFYLGNSSGTPTSNGPEVWLDIAPVSQPSNISSAPINMGNDNGGYINVTSLNFIVKPISTNLVGGQITNGDGNIQPQVFIQGTIQSAQDPNNVITVPFQTSISIPEYDIPST